MFYKQDKRNILDQDEWQSKKKLRRDGEGCNLSREERKRKDIMRQIEEMEHKGAESCCTGVYKRERLRRRLERELLLCLIAHRSGCCQRNLLEL